MMALRMCSNVLKNLSRSAGIFERGEHTLRISSELHSLNRQRLVEKLRAKDSLAGKTAIVVLQGGEATTRHDTDHEPLFRQESYFHWAFGVEEPDFYGAINVADGKSFLFAPRLPSEYAIWMGKLHSLEHFKERYGVDEAYYSDEVRF